MGYLQDIDREMALLRGKLKFEVNDEDFARILQFTKDKALQSYRNGLALKKAVGPEGERIARRYEKNLPSSSRRS